MTPAPSPASIAVSRYAVVGHPVAHSQSPFIHAAFAAQTGEPVSYDRLLCPLDGFAPALREFAAGGASGCNVTMPFKFEAFGLVAKTTPRARIAAACNVIRFDADGWLGDNTDGAGLVRDIERNAGVDLRGARILLIGAGGGAAGALGPLLASGASEVVVANRSVDKARSLVDRHLQALGGAASARVVATALDGCGEGFDVVVNATATSVAGAAVPVAASVLRRGGLALDMMYGPAAAAFVAWAAANGATGRDGLGMLVEQAAEAFLLWRGVEPKTAPVLRALRERIAAP
jgi:shikimate dehydrogenase